jgi:hypothetical protein
MLKRYKLQVQTVHIKNAFYQPHKCAGSHVTYDLE